MSTTEHPQRLTAFADGELSEAEAEAIRRHVQGCPVCAAELEALGRLQHRTARLAEVPSGASLWPRIADRVPSARRGHPAWPERMAYAALVAVGLFLGAWAGWSSASGPAPTETGGELLASSSLFGDPSGDLASQYLDTTLSEEDRP